VDYAIAMNETQRAAVSEDTPAAVTEFLAGRGITVTSVSICMDEAGRPEVLLITADADPAAAMADFTPEMVSAELAALRDGLARLRAFAAQDEPSLDNVIDGLRAASTLLCSLLRDDPRLRDVLS